MISPADALDLMTLVTACHRRTAPRMDDREVAIATASIWAELFNERRLEMRDLTAAVKKRALVEADAPEPAEIIRYAQDIRAERTQRESGEERRAREDRQDRALAAAGQRGIEAGRDFNVAVGGDGAAARARLAEMTRGFGKDIPDA